MTTQYVVLVVSFMLPTHTIQLLDIYVHEDIAHENTCTHVHYLLVKAPEMCSVLMTRLKSRARVLPCVENTADPH